MQRLTFGKQRRFGSEVALLGRTTTLAEHQRRPQLVAGYEAAAALRHPLARLHHLRCSTQAKAGQHVVVQAVATRINGVLRAVVIDPAEHPARLMVALVSLHAQALRVGVQIGGTFDVGADIQRQARRQRGATFKSGEAACQGFRHHRCQRPLRIAGLDSQRHIDARVHVPAVAIGPITGHAQHGHGRQDEQPGFQGRGESHRQRSVVRRTGKRRV
ncbi:hypothetical protein D3C73_1042280 [compost metagenome]